MEYSGIVGRRNVGANGIISTGKNLSLLKGSWTFMGKPPDPKQDTISWQIEDALETIEADSMRGDDGHNVRGSQEIDSEENSEEDYDDNSSDNGGEGPSHGTVSNKRARHKDLGNLKGRKRSKVTSICTVQQGGPKYIIGHIDKTRGKRYSFVLVHNLLRTFFCVGIGHPWLLV